MKPASWVLLSIGEVEAWIIDEAVADPSCQIVRVPGVEEACTALARLPDDALVVAVVPARGVDETGLVRVAEAAARGTTSGLGMVLADHVRVGQIGRMGRRRSDSVGEQLYFGSSEQLVGAQVKYCGPPQSTDAVVEKLTTPMELVFLDGPCGGEHMSLGNVMLCRADDRVERIGDLRAMPCHKGAACSLARPGLIRLSTASVRARRVVNITCSGLKVSNEPMLAVINPGNGLILNEYTEVVLTMIGQERDVEQDLAAAYYLVNSGITFGAVANQLNRMRLFRGCAATAVCIGDPFSSIARTIYEAELVANGEALLLCSALTSTRYKDVVVKLPVGWRDHVVVDLDGVASSGVVTDDGAMYLTLPGTCERVSLALVAPSSLESQVTERLYEDFEALTKAATRWSGNVAATEAVRALAQCLEVLDLWPIVDVRPATVISRRFLDGASEVLEKSIDQAQRAVMSAYLESLTGRGSTIPLTKLLEPSHYLVACQPLPVRCPTCGSPVDEYTFRRRARATTRQWGVCRACGPVYDGAGRVAKWFQCENEWVAGASAIVEMVVTNTYAVAMQCHGLAVVRGYNDSEGLGIHCACDIRLAPAETGVLIFRLRIPETALPGVHTLGAIALVGGQVVCLRRVVRLRPSKYLEVVP